ncbi:Hint domain-containing protein [Kozakia baliensis]|uniref:Hint domain-containing protein n=1 Tax=Kozakia baliensis TaxID=153496 RepID=UPI00087A557B|nr:Hint domain-containing protein [Kozakia baliensis]AOX20770.1 hypothetical protein A0U90_11315 [Kozakia baliensis]
MSNNWLGAASGDWFDAANWSDGQVPQSRAWDTAALSGNVTVSYAKANSTVLTNGLTVSNGATLNITATSVNKSQVLNVNGLNVAVGGVVNIQTASPILLGSSNVILNGTLLIQNSQSVSFGSSAARMNGSGTFVLDNATVGGNGATIDLDSQALTLRNGAKIYINNTTGSGAITFGPETASGAQNHLVLPDYGTTVSNPIYGFNNSSIITINNAQNASPIGADFIQNNYGSYTLEVKFNNYGYATKLTNIHFASGYTLGTPVIQRNADGTWSVANAAQGGAINNGILFESLLVVCFLPGTNILTPEGEVAVEDLRIGDRVVTLGDNGCSERAIIWAGIQTAVVDQHAPLADSGCPVRIARDAVEPGIPSRDLWVTPEHCLYFDGKFIPARMLVNGGSIAYDRSFSRYDYYHIETADHSVIFAESMPTESYLDTGNRAAFRQTGDVISIPKRVLRNWEMDAAAPLVTARREVEPLFRLLAECSKKLGFPPAEIAAQIVEDSNLHLVTEEGEILRPTRKVEDRVVFTLPAHCRQVRIVSRAARPSDVIGPFLDDRRHLGVLLSQVTLWDAAQTQDIDLGGLTTSGWYPLDGGLRWTNGDALLPLETREFQHSRMLALRVVAGGPYFEDDRATIAA